MQNSAKSAGRIGLTGAPDDFHRVDPRRGDWRNYVNEPGGPAAQRIEGSLKHMLHHMDKPLRVSTLSSLVGLSNSRFFLLFKEATGCSPIDYLIRLRMECACKMLMDQTVLIKQIAAALGYDDQFYFSRVFKATMGVGPSEYRRQQRRARAF
jgi:transcriptional regulator GlxA family with amidase domain